MITPAEYAGALPGPVPLLVGRDREQSLLAAAIDRAIEGRGGLVLISGEAGIGKTTLVAEAARQAATRGARVLVGRCYDLVETAPYGPWVDLFSRYTAAAGRPPVPAALVLGNSASVTRQETFFAQVRDCLWVLAAQRSLVLILDDLHWGDQASLELLRFLVHHVAATRILIVVTYRAHEVTPHHRLYPLVPQLVREAQPLRLDLLPLGPADVRALVRFRYGLSHADEDRLVAQLQERGEGNPFFIAELLHAFEEAKLLQRAELGWSLADLSLMPLPRLLRQVIDARLRQLGDAANGLLAIAAILGQHVSLVQWATIAEVDEPALLAVVERAIEAQVLTEDADGDHVHFAHALFREALYEGMLATRRRQWHRRVAESLARDVPADPAAIAYHFRQSGDPREATWLVLAGDRAQTLYLPRLAVEHYTRALELLRRSLPAEVQAIYRARGLAYEALGDFEPAHADLERALALAREMNEQHAEWEALLGLGFLWQERDDSQAGSFYQQAIVVARAMADPLALARSLNRVGNWYVNADEPATGMGHYREALAIFQERHEEADIAGTLDLMGGANYIAAGNPLETVTYFRDAAALARKLDNRRSLANSLSFLTVCITRGLDTVVYPLRVTEALQCGEEALRIAQEMDARASEAAALYALAAGLGTRGRYAAALEHGHRALLVAEEIGHWGWLSGAHWALGITLHDVLAVAPARQHLEQALAQAEKAGSRYFIRGMALALAETCITAGDFVRAEDLLAANLGENPPMNTQRQRCCWYVRAELAMAQGDPLRALAIVDRLVESGSRGVDGQPSPYLLKVRADALAALDRLLEAESALLAAKQPAEADGARPLLWRIEAALASLYHRQARHLDADQAAAAARSLIEELASDLPDDQLRNGFRSAATERLTHQNRRAPRRVSYPRGLSSREVDVLRLLAAGLSNAQIAAQLVVSERTVSTHLTSVYAKLGVSSRSAAVRCALDHGLR